MTKRILALMGVIMMLVLTCVPTFAASTSDVTVTLQQLVKY